MNNAPLPSFGRRRGRPLHSSRDALLRTLLPQLLIAPPESGTLNPETLFLRTAPLWLEIGFGGGEHLAGQAMRHPEINFIGCEPYINGMAKSLAVIDSHSLSNIRLFNDDARSLLEWLPDECIERLFVLFPDPWPKARHHKRRLIAQASLNLFYRKLAPSGRLQLATDHVDYGQWMLEQLLCFGKLRWTATDCRDWENQPVDWIPTRYQAKAAEEGRQPLFLEYRK